MGDVKKGNFGVVEGPKEVELQQQSCKVCNWPHFIIYTDQDSLVYSMCIGCGHIDGLGVPHFPSENDEE